MIASAVCRRMRPLRARLRLARAALLWERVWPAVWPPLAVLGVFAVLALFDLLPALPGLAACRRAGAARRWRSPRRWPGACAPVGLDGGARCGRRRGAASSGRAGCAHRPLQALADQPSGAARRQTAALWEAHQRRMEAAVRRLRVGWPAAGLAAARSVGRALGAGDPAAARRVIDAGRRLARARRPGIGAELRRPRGAAGGEPRPVGDAAGIHRAGAAIPARRRRARRCRSRPAASCLAQVHGGGRRAAPRDRRRGAGFPGGRQAEFPGRGDVDGRQAADADARAAATLGRWPIEIIPDNPPAIAFAQPPEGTRARPCGSITGPATITASRRVKAVIRRREGRSRPDETIELELPLPGLHLKEAQATSYHDLSPHPWAGLPVEIRLVATDALGQTGESEPVPDELAGTRASITRSPARSSTSARSWRAIPAPPTRSPRSSAI